MKIGVVGCGALGSYYGAKLCRDGREVHLLLRSDYEVVRQKGIRILSEEGDFHVNPKCARSSEEIGICDLVLIGLKTTANDQFAKLLPPLIGKSTAVFTLQNGLGNEVILADLFGKEKILGGLCFVCVNRIEPGIIQQVGRGRIVMGEFNGWPEPRTHDIASVFRHAGMPCEVTEHLEQAHWEKLVWNVPFNGLGVAGVAGFDAVLSGNNGGGEAGPCLTTKNLLSEERWEKLVRELMDEVIAAAQGLGLNVKNTAAEKELVRTRAMGDYKASTLIDFERGLPLELNALFLEPLRQARRAGVATPRLENLCSLLQHLDVAHQKGAAG
ncbi:MAG: 2-dehydropantoate 2-reductase [Verrucomicrobiota bacterium]